MTRSNSKPVKVKVKYRDRSTKIYPSIADASKAEGISDSAIQNRMKVHAPDRRGRMWYRAETL